MSFCFVIGSRLLLYGLYRLTVANEMLSLQGSIQPDPFSPTHVVQTHTTRQVEDAETDVDNIEAEVEDESEDDEAGSDVDTFKLLGHQAAEAVAVDKQKRKLEETQPEGPKKKKRKGHKEDEQVSEPAKTKRKKSK